MSLGTNLSATDALREIRKYHFTTGSVNTTRNLTVAFLERNRVTVPVCLCSIVFLSDKCYVIKNTLACKTEGGNLCSRT